MSLDTIVARDGVLYFSGGSEVSLFGTNYLPMSWVQYENLVKLGADFRELIRKDVAEMKKCGIQIVRVHFFDCECSDANGNLIDNHHLEVFDILVDEMNRQEVYFFFTPIAWWNSPGSHPDAFGRQMTIARMMFDPKAISKSARFVDQILNHTNRYTKTPLRAEPCLAVCEIMNEPIHIIYELHDKPDVFADMTNRIHDSSLPRNIVIRDVNLFAEMFRSWCGTRNVPQSRESYEEFQYDTELDYLTTMVDAFRNAGCDKPVAASLYQAIGAKPTKEIIEYFGLDVTDFELQRPVNQGIIRAVGDSPVDAVTTGGYPDMMNKENEFRNQMPEHAIAKRLPPEVDNKAVMIYEWDVCNTFENGTMYPAMARTWRSMRAQICCQFQYSDSHSGPYNADWGHHWFNYELTPAKSVSFLVASRLFSSRVRGSDFDPPADGFIEETAAVSFDHRQTLFVNDGDVYHSNTIGTWCPYDLPERPNTVVGLGHSPYVEYSGTGMYRLEYREDDVCELSLTHNIIPIDGAPVAIFTEGKIGKVKVVELDDSPETVSLLLSGWEQFVCADCDGLDIPVRNGRFDVVPGKSYILRRSANHTGKESSIE